MVLCSVFISLLVVHPKDVPLLKSVTARAGALRAVQQQGQVGGGLEYRATSLVRVIEARTILAVVIRIGTGTDHDINGLGIRHCLTDECLFTCSFDYQTSPGDFHPWTFD